MDDDVQPDLRSSGRKRRAVRADRRASIGPAGRAARVAEGRAVAGGRDGGAGGPRARLARVAHARRAGGGGHDARHGLRAVAHQLGGLHGRAVLQPLGRERGLRCHPAGAGAPDGRPEDPGAAGGVLLRRAHRGHRRVRRSRRDHRVHAGRTRLRTDLGRRPGAGRQHRARRLRFGRNPCHHPRRPHRADHRTRPAGHHAGSVGDGGPPVAVLLGADPRVT